MDDAKSHGEAPRTAEPVTVSEFRARLAEMIQSRRTRRGSRYRPWARAGGEARWAAAEDSAQTGNSQGTDGRRCLECADGGSRKAAVASRSGGPGGCAYGRFRHRQAVGSEESFVRLLLDSHALLWAFSRLPRLSDEGSSAHTDDDNEVFYSPVSLYEIAFKASRGRMPTAAMYLPEAVRFSDFREIPLTSLHLVCRAA